MKKLINICLSLTLIVFVSSCGELDDLDNYKQPDAKLFGSVVDQETGELIPQELITGSVIEYTELGFENPQIQQLRFHTEGTYRNNLMFSGEYEIEAVRGNFFAPEKQVITVNGDTEVVLSALPYIRIKDATIENTGRKIEVSFRVEQVATENVLKLSMVADENPNVGKAMSITSASKTINGVVDPNTVYTLGLRLSNFEVGKEYFFRVGAIIDIPEAKYNYNVPIRFKVEE